MVLSTGSLCLRVASSLECFLSWMLWLLEMVVFFEFARPSHHYGRLFHLKSSRRTHA